MALLGSTIINATAGLTYVSLPFYALSIVCVKREGTQYDRTSGTPTGRQWKLSGGLTLAKIRFDASIPLNSGEKVFVIYKPLS